MNLKRAAASLESLGHEKRLAIFRALVKAGPSGLAVGQLQERLNIPASTLSHHVAHLVRHHLVDQTREGRMLRCCANYATMNSLINYLQDECCAGA